MTVSPLRLSRRSALILPLATAMPGRARAAMPTITDALGRTVTLKMPPERIVVCFNYEEFTAVGGPGAWAKVVGMSKTLWSEWRPSVFRRYSAVIPTLAAMPDVGNTEDGNFSVETLLALRPDLLILAEWSFNVLGEQIKHHFRRAAQPGAQRRHDDRAVDENRMCKHEADQVGLLAVGFHIVVAGDDLQFGEMVADRLQVLVVGSQNIEGVDRFNAD